MTSSFDNRDNLISEIPENKKIKELEVVVIEDVVEEVLIFPKLDMVMEMEEERTV